MSTFLCEKYHDMEPYVPGEQPKDRKYIKLNANESSLPPSPKVIEAITNSEINGMGHYSDPNCLKIRNAIAGKYNVDVEQVFAGNGSDEVLGFCFMSFFSAGTKVCFPDITYDFYRVYAKTYNLDMLQIPLKEDFNIDIQDYINTDRHVIIANPNNPIGLRLTVDEIEQIVKAKPNRLVIIDEAYVDYGNESCVRLVNKYSNLIVVQTFSKSRNLAGAHIGYAISTKEIIQDLNNIKFSFNPFNLSTFTIEAGTASMKDVEYLNKCVNTTIDNREYTKEKLEEIGFRFLDSHTNFLFGYHPEIRAGKITKELKEKGILIRYYDMERIDNYFRITIGKREEMDKVIETMLDIVKENTKLWQRRLSN